MALASSSKFFRPWHRGFRKYCFGAAMTARPFRITSWRSDSPAPNNDDDYFIRKNNVFSPGKKNPKQLTNWRIPDEGRRIKRWLLVRDQILFLNLRPCSNLFWGSLRVPIAHQNPHPPASSEVAIVARPAIPWNLFPIMNSCGSIEAAHIAFVCRILVRFHFAPHP